ncbi:hypothetical protein [Rhizobium sp. Root651]|uniref:hypothetical protein n=1 Tax=Rhizobium sp. Root651 TaxID=1736577 RepID=UPI0007130DE6|nr:hypothetical protein [Rhizobium sp. Root651]KRA63073.1 hypothetical protein ASD85_06370 [Rhizobium sp. Root651]
MQSEVLNVINDLKLDMTASPVDDVTIITRAQLKAIEAALSAAEPVAWQPLYKKEVINHMRTVSNNVWEYAMTVYPTKEQAEEYGHGGHEVRALYDRPQQPAPSVAVKALADAYKAGFDASSQGYNGEVFPEYEADNEWLAQRDSDLSALSAQVQDVAGWQPIETAPKDGSTFLAVMAEAYSPRTTLCKFENGGFLSPSQGEKFVVPGWNQWWPTHWMPLPAAPAKQEN